MSKAAAISLADIRKLVATCDDSPAGQRDRALLLIGFAGALRRSELVALQLDDVSHTATGLRIRIRRGKTDAAGEGAEIGLPRGLHVSTCPVRALGAWCRTLGQRSGAVFRKISAGGRIGRDALAPDAVRRILLRRAAQADLPVQGRERLTAHGLRAGFITEAYDKGVRDEDIMRHSRHRDLKTMRGYVRRAQVLQRKPSRADRPVIDIQYPWDPPPPKPDKPAARPSRRARGRLQDRLIRTSSQAGLDQGRTQGRAVRAPDPVSLRSGRGDRLALSSADDQRAG